MPPEAHPFSTVGKGAYVAKKPPWGKRFRSPA